MTFPVKQYLEEVCQQVRWNKAHDVIQKELSDHIEDQTEAFLAEGIAQEEAVAQAIATLGDPILVGTELDRAYRPQLQWQILLFPLLLLSMSILLRFYMIQVLGFEGNMLSYLLGIFVGIVAFMGAYFLDFTVVGKYAFQLYGGYMVCLILIAWGTEMGYIGNHFYGKAVMDFGGRLSPLLLLLPVYLSGLIYRCRKKGYGALFFCCFAVLPPVFLLYIVGYGSASFFTTVLCLLLLTLVAWKGWFFMGRYRGIVFVALCFLLFGGILFVISPWARWRLYHCFSPFLGHSSFRNDYFSNFVIEVRTLVKGAVFWGEGTGTVLPTWIQEPDYWLLVLLHHFGWMVVVFVVMVYGSFLWKGISLARKQKSQLGNLVAMTILLLFGGQSVWYVAMNLGALQFLPFQLPFLCQQDGFLDIAVPCMLLGILLSVFRIGETVQDTVMFQKIQKNTRVSYVDGVLQIRLRKRK